MDNKCSKIREKSIFNQIFTCLVINIHLTHTGKVHDKLKCIIHAFNVCHVHSIYAYHILEENFFK